MENWIYKNILNKIKKVENAIKRLELTGFTVSKNRLKEIIIANNIYDEDATLDYLKIHNELNDLLNHLHKLEKIYEYYELIKFRLNNDRNICLCLDIYVSDTLDVLKPLNAEIREYGYKNLGKFVTKFYNLVYFLIKLEIGLNGESEICRELLNHSGHAYHLREIVISDLNRVKMSNDNRQYLKNGIKEKKDVGIASAIIVLIKGDKKIRKLLNLTDDDMENLVNRTVISDQEALLEIKRLVKKNN